MKIHELKTWPEYYQDISDRIKNFEIRKNDRDFKPGEMLELKEWCPEKKEYTGRYCRRMITYILPVNNPFIKLPPGTIIMSIK